jgi:nucleotide-binding universal stress UspA family protein
MANEAIYVSWGGTGRGEAVRAAVDRAGEAGQDLLYLAILDDEQFGDLSPALADTVRSELHWLLRAQLRMVNLQTDPDVKLTIEIRQGDVEDELISAAKDLGADLILLGAPLPKDSGAARRRSIDELVEVLRRETGADVEIVGPEA